MAEGPINPRAKSDPRFEPATDAENARAHGEEPQEDDSSSDRAEEIQSTVKRMLEEARRHYAEELEPEQVLATDYYHGEPFGDEREGRSKVVSTDVRDATLAQMGPILDVIYGPERVVEYEPEGPEDEEIAAQQTDGVNYVVLNDSDAFTNFHDWVQDGLVRKIGVVKWWVEDDFRTEATHYTGLTQEDLSLLASDESTADYVVEGVQQTEVGPLYNCYVRRKTKRKRIKWEAVPSEEFVYTPNSRTLDAAPLVAHVRMVPADELIAMGIDEELVKEAQGKTSTNDSDSLKSAREFHGSVSDWAKDDDRDDSQKPVLFADAYALIDGDGDGIGERRLFQCIGPDHEIVPDKNGELLGEIVDDMVPFAVWSPYRRAHAIVGDGNFDLLRDVQRIKSQVLRGTLDSLAQSITPITEVVRGKVNMPDLLNPDVDKIVRVEAPGMMREVKTSFVGPDTLPVLAYFDSVKEDRTGTSKAAMGLDADALQSTTKAAVAATTSGAQQRLKFIVRMLAETGMRRLFRGVCALTIKHQDKPRWMKLRNKWVQVDPRYWNASLDLRVNVGLGQGTPEDRINAHMGILTTQKEMQALGMPFVGMSHIRASVAKITELAGERHTEKYFDPWGAEDDKQMKEQQSQQQPPPDPNMMLVQVEQMKAQMQDQIDQQKLALEQWKATMEDDRERDKIARDSALREYEIELKHKAEINDAELKAHVAHQRAQMDTDVKREQARNQPTTGEAA